MPDHMKYDVKQIEDRLKNIVENNRQFDIIQAGDAKKAAATWDEYILDSLMIVRVLVDCEDEFGIVFCDEDLGKYELDRFFGLRNFIIEKMNA